VTATDDLDLDVKIVDLTEWGTLAGTMTAAGLQYGRLAASSTASRDTQATVGAGTIAGAATVSAASTGAIRGEVDSTIVGKVDHTVTRDDVLAEVSGSMSASGLTVSALSGTTSTALGKVARNQATGTTIARATGATLTVGAGGIAVAATDASVLTALASFVITEAWTPLVALAASETRNVFDRSVEASVAGSSLTTPGDVAVSALEDGRLLSVTEGVSVKIKSGVNPIESAKGFAATLAANVYAGSVKALISSSTVSARDVTVSATNDAFVDATGAIAATGDTDSDAVTFKVSYIPILGTPGNMAGGASIAINVIGWSIGSLALATIDAILGGTDFGTDANPLATEASITASAVSATGALSVEAASTATVNSTISNAATSTQHAFFGASSAAAGAVVAMNKVNATTSAATTGGAVGAAGAVQIAATDTATIASNVKVVSNSVTTTDSGLHFAGKFVNKLLDANHTTAATSAPVQVDFGTRVRVLTGHTAGGTAGVVYQYMGAAPVALNLSTTDFTNLALWKPLAETQIVPQGINFDTSDSRALAATIVVNDVQGGATASSTGTALTGASVRIEATEAATITALADVSASSAGGSTLTGQGASVAAGGVLAVNRILSAATASATGGSITATVGDVTIAAANAADISATNLSTMSSGASSIGIMLAFNTIGWKPSNVLFQVLDAILGDPLLSDVQASRTDAASPAPRSPPRAGSSSARTTPRRSRPRSRTPRRRRRARSWAPAA
jgi:hypothetical protein